jgi:MFS family permease
VAALTVLFLINVLNFYDRQALGALAEPIRREFHLNDTQLGMLGTIFTVLYAIVGVPLGRIADSWSRKKLLALGVTVWASMTAASAFVANYAMLVATRLGVGVGEAVCAPTATSWISDLFPVDQRSRALAFFMFAVPLGSGLSFIVSGPAAQAFGWRAALVIAALPAIALVPALLLLREPERGAAERAVPTAARSLLRIPTFVWIIASGALLNFNLYALGTFLPAFFTRFHGLSVAQSGLWSGIGHAAGGLLAATAGGWIGDRVFRRWKKGRLLAAALAALLAAPVGFMAIVQPAGSWMLAMTLISLAYGLLNVYYGTVYASIHDIVAPALRGTAMAVYFMAMYLCGASFGPLLTGRLSDMMARRAAAITGSATITESAKAIGLHQAMFLIPALSLALAIVLFAGSRTVERDIARRDQPFETNL